MKALVLAIGALSVLFPASATAQTDLPAVQFGLVGLARGETARLHAVNLLAPPCRVTLEFLHEQSEAFPGAVAEIDLESGQAAHLDLPAPTAFASPFVPRMRFRASVETSAVPSTDTPPGPCAGVVSTLELFDQVTGRIVAFYPSGSTRSAPSTNANPGPPDAYGMVGLARLQAAILTVLNLTSATPGTSAPACRVSLTFLDETGQMFSSGRTPRQGQVDLLPGQFASLTLPASLVFAASRELRQDFRASVEVDPGPVNFPPNPCDGLVNTLELVDTLTGRAQAIYPAGSNPGPSQ
jgi:hypothetical protein